MNPDLSQYDAGQQMGRAKLAAVLNKLRANVSADNPGNAGYLTALDDVARSMNLEREEQVTYHA